MTPPIKRPNNDKMKNEIQDKIQPKSEPKTEHKSEQNEHREHHHERIEFHEHHEHIHKHRSPVPGGPCEVESTQQPQLMNIDTPFATGATIGNIKVPVVIAEPTLQIVVESNIELSPAATEIKRVKKNVFLEQVKLVPVAFERIGTTDFFNVTRAKVFVAGHIRKNIEYASHECNGVIQDLIANVQFTGFADISTGRTPGGILNPPIIGIAESAEANFLNQKTNMDARLDKYFFQNLVKYNEQPYGELVAANFFELDFSPTMKSPEGSYSKLREKIVMDITLKVLQVQQLAITGTQIVPALSALTPPPTL